MGRKNLIPELKLQAFMINLKKQYELDNAEAIKLLEKEKHNHRER